MWIIVFLGFIVVTFLIGQACREELIEVLPVSTGGLLLILYILALMRNMNIIVIFAAFLLIVFAAAQILMGKEGRKVEIKAIKKFFLSSRSLTAVVALVGIAVLTSGHVATWWDDINYWATDAKALFFLNGFTGKYGNVAPEFGDYPPGIQLMKWCFAKLNPSEYKEGLSFAGYYVMNMIFCMPVLKKTKGKNLLVQMGSMLVVFLIPGVVNDVWSHGACADITMGLVYGAVLIAAFDIEDHIAAFYYGRLMILLSLLPLTKSVGFEWAAYAAVMVILLTIINRQKLTEKYGSRYKIYTLISIMTAVSFQFSWWIYCLLTRRIAKLTSSGAHMATGGYSLPDNAGEKALLFSKGFAFCPMHTDITAVLDLSSLTMIVIIVWTIIALGILKKTSKEETVLLLIYSVATAIIAYGIIFVGHITIFATETQYSTPQIMAISISRYAAPFTVGMLMLLIYIVTERCSGKLVLAGCAVFVLLTTDYVAAYNCLWGYRSTAEADREGRDSVIDDNGRIYADTVRGDERLWGHRVLYFRDATEIHWVKDTHINHEVAPVPTVYADIKPDAMTAEDIGTAIATSHAEYIYVDDVSYQETGMSGSELFGNLIVDENGQIVGNQFEYGKVYKIK